MKTTVIFIATLLAITANCVSASCEHKRLLRHNPPTLFAPTEFGFSHVTIDTKNKVAYIAGQTALAMDGKTVQNGNTDEEDKVPAQLDAAAKNLILAIQSVGVTPALQKKHVMSMTMYIVGYKQVHIQTVKKIGMELGSPSNTLVGIEALAFPSLKVEIEAIVAIPQLFIDSLKSATCEGNVLLTPGKATPLTTPTLPVGPRKVFRKPSERT